MTTKIFAPDYGRQRDTGWIVFPRDKADRDALFIPESFDHPAKANLYLVEELVRYTTEPGDWILDVTAGTGTVLVAGKMGRKVVMIELSSVYAGWIRQNAEKMGVEEYILLEGDCRDHLPVSPVRSIIFSPPYAGTFKNTVGQKLKADYQKHLDAYQGTEGKNLGELNPFYYNVEMGKVYSKCWESLLPGGTLCLIIKDAYLGSKLEQLGYRHIQMMLRLGFEVQDWFEWASPGTQFRAIHKARGNRTVDSEHIIVMRKV